MKSNLLISIVLGLFLLEGAAVHAQLSVNAGLVLWLKADESVATNADGFVTDWADASPNLNDASQHADGLAPLFVPDAVHGKPALRFDGVDDYLEIANSALLQPQSGGWTVFFVAKRFGGSQGDFPEVIGSRPWTAGLDKGWAVSFDGNGLVCSHYADGTSGHDVPAVRSASPLSSTNYQMWQVEEDRDAGATSFYANGDLDRSIPTAAPIGAIDQQDPIRIGREIGGANNRRANMDLAEVIVYNRVLTRTERDAVASYLSDKYGLGFTPNVAPTISITSPVDGATFGVPEDFSFTASASDADGSIRQVDFLWARTASPRPPNRPSRSSRES